MNYEKAELNLLFRHREVVLKLKRNRERAHRHGGKRI